jgi:hypothetical protein
MKAMKQLTSLAYGLSLAMVAGGAAAHDIDEAGEPVCTEANYMMADAQNTPFASAFGPGRVIEMNIFTGTPGITVGNPFNGGNAGTDICPDPDGDGQTVQCPGPWKPTGVLSGGENGHAFITSAAQQALTQFHRDGTPIRTVSYRPLLGNPTGNAGRGSLPRPLGTQLMPNGNLIQAICDANFFNAQNSDRMAPGESGNSANADPTNSSWMYFPPVYATDARQDNSRLLVIDQSTMEVIDEYSRPKKSEPGYDLWGCAAGIMFDDTGMWISTFHGAAVLRIDWKAGLSGTSTGVGSNDPGNFSLDRNSNRAQVTEVVDFRLGEPENNEGWRRDSLRAISFDESGNIYATDRERSKECVRGEAPGASPNPSGVVCNPSVFRQRVNIASLDGYNDPALRRTLGLDPGVNVIAGIRTNRMSGVACDYVRANPMTYATELADGTPANPNGYAKEGDLCDVETLLIAASAFNPGCDANNDGTPGPGHQANQCFVPGGGVGEYIIHPNFTDGANGPCNGDPNDAVNNTGCAQPVATFEYTNASGTVEKVDPRMLMVIHEAFGQ